MRIPPRFLLPGGAFTVLLAVALSPIQAGPPSHELLPVQKWLAAQKPVSLAAEPLSVWQKEEVPVLQKSLPGMWQNGPVQSVQKTPVDIWQKSAPVCACPPARRISYWDHRICRKKCCSCAPPVKMVLVVSDPCCSCGCPIEVPVCVPGCCPGSPLIGARHDLLGRGVVTCTWQSGFKVRIVFRHTGNVVVHYCGH